MPILFIHGVSVRDDSGFDQIEPLLRRFAAPAISDEPDSVTIEYCYWGDQAARLSWSGSSIPLSIGHRAIERSMERIRHRREQLVKAGRVMASSQWLTKVKEVRRHSKERLSDFLASTIQASNKLTAKEKAALCLALDEAVQEEGEETIEESIKNPEALQKRIRDRCNRVLVSLGNRQDWSEQMSFNLKEYATRAYKLPASAATKVAMELRAPIHRFITLFLGDVFTYLYRRGDASDPGPIPTVVLSHLERLNEIKKSRDGEPLLVLTHSMGGQVVYDIVSHFLPLGEHQDVRIDFWCATASQVGFFEELKLFLASSDLHGEETGELAPYPDDRYLGYWWNVWDYNDFVSYSADGIINGVDDEAYGTGMDVVEAHMGYLFLPSFYRRMRSKLQTARRLGWKRPDPDSELQAI
ncbi:MAG: hypothetical protein IPM23_08255 [Candidatus Melainabacteria bacterium]|nr:hypothetical protein [Candidatus Melainabacteria bacterium]